MAKKSGITRRDFLDDSGAFAYAHSAINEAFRAMKEPPY